jgi:hypothetical protein
MFRIKRAIAWAADTGVSAMEVLEVRVQKAV